MKTFRASSLPALSLCACFTPDGEERDFQEAGTDRHAAMNETLATGRTGLLDLLPDEDADGVRWAIDYIRFNIPTGYPMNLEERLVWQTPDYLLSGQPDVVALNHVFDLKWRPRDYRAQLAAYGLLLIRANAYEHVVIHVLYGEAKRAVKYTLDITEAQNETLPIISMAFEEEAPPVPNPYCGWCAKKLTCPAINERVLEVARAREDWKIEHYHPSKITDPREMSKALDLAPLMEKWCESVRYHAREMAVKQALTIPGYSLKDRTVREITEVTHAFHEAQLPPEKFLKACSVTWSGLYDQYASHHQVTKAEAKRKIDMLLDECSKRTHHLVLKKD